MVKIIIDIEEDLNTKIEVYKAQLKLGSKPNTIKHIIKSYFDNLKF